jgi:hypothetical protein
LDKLEAKVDKIDTLLFADVQAIFRVLGMTRKGAEVRRDKTGRFKKADPK